MAARKVKENVYEVGAIDWDRRLFDELIPLPDGTSYNAYIIKGSEKVALIDTVDPPKKDVLINNIKSLNVGKIDYIIANHAEQDHSGSIPFILEIYKDAKVVTNPKCKAFLKDLLLIEEERFITVEDGETLSLGDKTLEFIYTPWVHWPETMSTYLTEDKILFSCDFFGSHRATSSLFVQDKCKVLESAKRYYAEIMMPFRTQIKKNIDKILEKEISIIAPSHGPLYDDPDLIIEAYKEWISDNVERKVLIPYVSMHGSTEAIVNYITSRLMENNIRVIPMNLTKTDLGEFAIELVDAKAVIIATPYVLTGAHPQIVYAVYLMNALKPKVKYIGMVASYSWGGKGIDQLKNLITGLKAEILEPILIKGYPKKEDTKKLDEFVNKLKEII